MTYNPLIHHRRSIRLSGFDYSHVGAYFITICCHNRNCLFGTSHDGDILLNTCGEIAYNEWIHTNDVRENIELGAFIVMPNHIHGIIHLQSAPSMMDDIPLPLPSNSIGAIIRGYKASVTKQIRNLDHTKPEDGTRSETKGEYSSQQQVWQRNYYEHVIRTAASLQSISQYITNNPATWSMDELYRLR